VSVSVSKRSSNKATAAVGGMSSLKRDVDESANECNIQNDGDEAEDCNAAKAAGQEDSEDGVKNGGAGDTLNGLVPCWVNEVVFCLGSEEVGEDDQADSCCEELDDAKYRLG